MMTAITVVGIYIVGVIVAAIVGFILYEFSDNYEWPMLEIDEDIYFYAGMWFISLPITIIAAILKLIFGTVTLIVNIIAFVLRTVREVLSSKYYHHSND